MRRGVFSFVIRAPKVTVGINREREKRRKEDEEGRRKKRRRRKSRFGNLFSMYGIHVWDNSFVWNS